MRRPTSSKRTTKRPRGRIRALREPLVGSFPISSASGAGRPELPNPLRRLPAVQPFSSEAHFCILVTSLAACWMHLL